MTDEVAVDTELDSLPAPPLEYVGYPTISVCGNILSGPMGIPFLMGGEYPLLVGQSPKGPLIWLKAPTDAEGKKWITVMSANQANQTGFRIARENSDQIAVKFQGRPLVTVRYREAFASITQLDLRPIGVNVEGSAGSLRVGTGTFTSCAFSNSPVMLRVK